MNSKIRIWRFNCQSGLCTIEYDKNQQENSSPVEKGFYLEKFNNYHIFINLIARKKEFGINEQNNEKTVLLGRDKIIFPIFLRSYDIKNEIFTKEYFDFDGFSLGSEYYWFSLSSLLTRNIVDPEYTLFDVPLDDINEEIVKELFININDEVVIDYYQDYFNSKNVDKNKLIKRNKLLEDVSKNQLKNFNEIVKNDIVLEFYRMVYNTTTVDQVKENVNKFIEFLDKKIEEQNN